MSKRPWFKLWVDAWNIDTSVMTLEEQGAYMRLLTLQWRDGMIPTDPKKVARALGVVLDHYMSELSPMVTERFPDGRNPRLERERREADGISEIAAANGRKGANITNGARRNSAAADYQQTSGEAVGEESTIQKKELEERDQKKKEQKKPSPASPVAFDFETVYKAYPKKLGRKRGLKLCESRVKSASQYSDLQRAVTNYARSVEGTDPKFIKHFDTFMGCWEDYVDADLLSRPAATRSVGHAAPAPHNTETSEHEL
jgi:uncharacterized protein YdaU (DUF1376 family)